MRTVKDIMTSSWVSDNEKEAIFLIIAKLRKAFDNRFIQVLAIGKPLVKSDLKLLPSGHYHIKPADIDFVEIQKNLKMIITKEKDILIFNKESLEYEVEDNNVIFSSYPLRSCYAVFVHPL